MKSFATVGVIGFYGIYDTETAEWIGTEAGPITYEDEEIAKAAEVIWNNRFRYAVRLRARVYDGTGTKKTKEVTPKVSGLHALKQAEGQISPRPQKKKKGT